MKIDLSYSNSYPEPISASKPGEKSYPCLHIDGGSDSLCELPDEGELTLKFKVRSRTVSEVNGKKKCSVVLEAQEISEVEGEDTEADENDSTAEALDKLARLLSAKESSDD